ncbi:protein FAR1-RELATED SEQUENCE 5-like [Sesbania bispinosa]|nr:protein FAR1-RELATED SEQUENCE 5-like [Sesbania bispinosa]
MAEDCLENGLKSLERMLRNTNLGNTSCNKPAKVDDDTSDEEKNEHSKLISRKLLDPQCVWAKGITNARLKIQLEKKRCKKSISQGHSNFQGASHVDKDKASSTRAIDFSTFSIPSLASSARATNFSIFYTHYYGARQYAAKACAEVIRWSYTCLCEEKDNTATVIVFLLAFKDLGVVVFNIELGLTSVTCY